MSSQLSLIDVLPTNLTCPIAALKHSPSKRTKSVKSKPTSQPSGQAVAGGSGSSGQDCSAPPSKEGKTSWETSWGTSWETSSQLSLSLSPSSESGVQVSLWLIADEISGMAKGSPESTESAAPASPSPPPQCVLPAVLRDRPGAGRPQRGAPPPVPPRSPRRPADGSSSTCRGGQRVLAVDLTTKIWETPMSTYRNKCGVRRIVQGRVGGDMVWKELGWRKLLLLSALILRTLNI